MREVEKVAKIKNKKGKRLRKLVFSFVLIFTFLNLSQASAISKQPLIDGSSFVAVDSKTGNILFRKDEEASFSPKKLSSLLALGLLYESGELKGSEKEIASLLNNFKEDKVIKFLASKFGSEEAVLSKVGKRIETLGLKNTKLANLSGDSADNKTNMKEASLLLSKMLAQPKIQKELSFKKIEANKEVEVAILIIGEKEDAYSFALGKMGESNFFSINIGGASQEGNENDSKKILQYTLENYRTYQVIEKGKKVESIKVKGGRESYCDVVAKDDLFITLPRGTEDSIVKDRVKIKKELIAPVKKGIDVGTFEALEAGEVTATVGLITGEEIVSGGPWSKIGISDYMMAIGSLIIFLILLIFIVFKIRKRKKMKKLARQLAEKKRRQQLILEREREEKRRRNWPY